MATEPSSMFDAAALETGMQTMFVGDEAADRLMPPQSADATPDVAPTQRFDALYYVRPDGSPSGEVDLHQANQLMESGQLNGNTFVWADGMEEWAKLCDCKALFVVNLDNMKLHYETTASLPSDVVTVREVRNSLRTGGIHAGTLVWAEGMDEWARLSECHSFFGLERDLIPPARENSPASRGTDAAPVRIPGGGAAMAPAPAPPLALAPAPIAAPPTSDRARGARDAAAAEPAAVPMPKSYGTDWNCRQRVALEKERVISSMEFDETGNYIALGDTGGNVTIMKRNNGGKAGDAEFGQHFDFSAHEPEFDALKSVEIPERVNCVRWVPKHRPGTTLLTCNDKTVKLWRVSEGGPTAATYGSTPRPAIEAWGGSTGADDRLGIDGRQEIDASALRLGQGPKKVRRAKMSRSFKNAHNYTMNSISCCSDGATFISSDDLRVYLWSYERADEAFLTLDLKPDNLEDLTEVITTSKFHPEHCHLLGYSNSRGQMKLHDLRQSALCSGHAAKLFHDTTTPGSPDGEGLFDELLASISDITFGGRQVFVRDLMTVRVWDLAMTRAPVRVIDVADSLRPRLSELWETERIFDRFEVAVTPSGDEFATGSYGNTTMVVGSDGQNHGWFEAGRQLLLQRPWRGPPARAKLDQRIMSLTWHPTERMLAVAAENTMYIHADAGGKSA